MLRFKKAKFKILLILGLIILGVGLLMRNTIVIFAGLIWLVSVWIWRKQKSFKKEKGKDNKIRSISKEEGKISGPVGMDEPEIYNLDEELKRWK